MGFRTIDNNVCSLIVRFDLIDLRTLIPLDKDLVFQSVNREHELIILHEDTMIGGFGLVHHFLIAEKYFEFLQASAIKRSASIDKPVPFANLE